MKRFYLSVLAATLAAAALLALAHVSYGASASTPGASLVESANPEWTKTGWAWNAIAADTILCTPPTWSVAALSGLRADSTAVLPTTGFRVISGFIKVWAPAPVDTAARVVLAIQVRAHATQSADSANTVPIYDWQVSGAAYDSAGTINLQFPSAGNGTEKLFYLPAAWCMPGSGSGAAIKRVYGDNGGLITIPSRGGAFAFPFFSIRIRVISSGGTVVRSSPRVLLHLYGAR